MSYILVTNDDGIESPSLHLLARAMAERGHVVTVAAPTTDRSGSGASVGHLWLDQPVKYSRQSHGGPFETFAVDIPPAAIVSLAVNGAFGRRPDLVVSGVNPGWNIGHGLIHSGTFGAALTASSNGVPGVAVSMDHRLADDGLMHWETATLVAAGVVEAIIERGLTQGAYNVNVPNVAVKQLRGLKQAELAPVGSMWQLDVQMTVDGIRAVPTMTDRRPPHGTDLAALMTKWASLTYFQGLMPAVVPGRLIVEKVEQYIGDAVPVDRASRFGLDRISESVVA